MKKWIRNKHGVIVGLTYKQKATLRAVRDAKRALDSDTMLLYPDPYGYNDPIRVPREVAL